jgi:hypothetical protein
LVKFGSDAVPERRYETTVAVAIFVLVGVRLACAAFTPLSFDESLYWIWSKHIAGGYYDHPPMNPILIRLGTTLFRQHRARRARVRRAARATGKFRRLARGGDPVRG